MNSYTLIVLSCVSSLALSLPWGEDKALAGEIVEASEWEPVEFRPIESGETSREKKGLQHHITGEGGVFSRLGNFWTWDREAVKKGIFENENIMIHVGQNLFNFVFSTLAWFTVSQIYSATAGLEGFPREARQVSFMDAADEVLAAVKSFEHKYRK